MSILSIFSQNKLDLIRRLRVNHKFLAEFVKVLQPGGAAILQVCSWPSQLFCIVYIEEEKTIYLKRNKDDVQINGV